MCLVIVRQYYDHLTKTYIVPFPHYITQGMSRQQSTGSIGRGNTSLSSSAESNGSVIVTEIWKFPSTQRKGHRETEYLY